jgi:hypothetical protein
VRGEAAHSCVCPTAAPGSGVAAAPQHEKNPDDTRSPGLAIGTQEPKRTAREEQRSRSAYRLKLQRLKVLSASVAAFTRAPIGALMSFAAAT